MRIVQKINGKLIEIYFIEAGEEQLAGTILCEKNIFKVADMREMSTIKKTKNEAIDWLLVQSGYDI